MVSKRASVFVAALCCVLSAFAFVEGRYFLEVSVHGYSNPTGRCRECSVEGQRERGCCDRFRTTVCSGDLLCDSFFTYCIGNGDGGCTDPLQQRTSAVNVNDGPVNFSQSTVLGLENPLTLQGLTHAYHDVLLHITITDQDPDPENPDELVDIIEIYHNLPVGEASPRRNYTGVYNFDYVIMDLSTRVLCAPNFEGSDCTECVPGFSGKRCDENIDDCAGISCSGHGVCEDGINTFNCRCEHGFTGALCEINADECGAVNCSGLGQCVVTVNSFRCVCATGFTGQLCEINIDDCQLPVCSGHGQCTDGINSFICNCEPGFTGQNCEININECSGVNCSDKGVCNDGDNTFTCECIVGYTGPLCDVNINNCDGVTCSGHGNCVDGVASFTCTCDPGFTGESCDIDIDECMGVNCSGNGECIDGINSFTCQCSPDHSGPLCTEEFRNNDPTGPVVGAIVVSLILILMLVVALVLVMRYRNGQTGTVLKGKKTGVHALPGDNPVYDGGDAAIVLGALPWTDVPIHYENLSPNAGRTNHRSAPDREFDNPIYGLENGMRTHPDNYPQTGVGLGAAPYHEFDNPIYGQEIDDNIYSVISDSSVPNGTSTASDARLNGVYENMNEEAPLTGSQQISDHIN